MPERHAELAWRFGEPDECHEEAGEDEDAQEESRWVLHSPLPPIADLQEHLRWASESLRPHEAFVGELISLGGRVVLKIRHESASAVVKLRWDARLLLPMAHTGIEIELEVLGGG